MASHRHDRPRPRGAHRPERHGRFDLLEEASRLLRAGEPLELLNYASGLVAALDPRRADPLARVRATSKEPNGLAHFVEALGDTADVGAAALLASIAELAPDAPTRTRARTALIGRDEALPEWLTHLGATSVARALTVSHALGDGEDVMLELRVAGRVATIAVYVDHDLGTVVKDAFVIPVGPDRALEAGRRALGDPDLVVADADLADARARVAEALDLADATYPPYESETWPLCQPLLEWALRTLPEGGAGYARAEWDDDARDSLSEEFFASEAGRALDDGAHRDLFDSLVWYKTGYGAGDPLRWSAVSVEIVLDWLPRKVLGPEGQLALAPELLRALIPYGHARRGIRPELTAEALATLERFEPAFRRRLAR